MTEEHAHHVKLEQSGLENYEHTLDGRLDAAKQDLEQTSKELDDYLKTRDKHEDERKEISGLSGIFHRVAESISAFIKALCGGNTAPDEITPELAAITARLNMETQSLKDLAQLRNEFADVAHGLDQAEHADEAHIHDLQGQTNELHEELKSAQQLILALQDKIAHLQLPPVDPHPDPTPSSPQTPAPEQPQPAEDKEFLVGDVTEDAQYVVQQGNNDQGWSGTCTVVSQEMILNKLEHNPQAYDERTLVNEAMVQGWCTETGGFPYDFGKLIEAHGHHVERKDSDIQELVSRVSHGEEAIISVNSGILWGEPSHYHEGKPNHAVWVGGFDIVQHPDGTQEIKKVYVNDSGTGKQLEMSYDQFKQAWDTSNDFAAYVSA